MREKQCLASAFLLVAMIVPAGALVVQATDDGQQAQGQDAQDNRVYDPAFKDYHVWDAREEEAYRRWLDQQREPYVYHGQLSERTQRDYWKWRHKDMKRERHAEHAENEHQ